jgi:phosphoglycerol transferase MdoB-like AlkP superfamily enzyme
MGFKEFWGNKSYVAQMIYIVIIVYCSCSINVLIFALGAVQFFDGTRFVTEVLVFFALMSFALTLCLGIFHIRSMVKQDKRKTDKLDR